MASKEIIGVAGAGAMGSGIARVAATAGHPVIVADSDLAALERARASLLKGFEHSIEKGKITREASEKIIASITFTNRISDFSSCRLIIEAIIENLEIKKALFRQMEEHVSNTCILASNTSSLPVVAIASACNDPSRVVGIHFFNPAILMPLVEIIPAFTTDENVTREARELINSWGKTTVLAKDTPGFIVNRVARPFYGESIKMYEEGIASFETIDWAMKEFGGFRMGPFELMDFIGNDINYTVTETVWEQFFYDPRYRPSLTQKRLYEAGLFGRKTGRGYYRYDNNAPAPQPDKDAVKGAYIFKRVLAMLINEAAEAVYLNIATRDDIDLAMVKGVNYPKGLLKWADETGIGNVLEILNGLHNDYGDDRYRPSLLLKKMAAGNRNFY